jgi:hypothetical protein
MVRATITIFGLLTLASQLWLGPRSAESGNEQDDITGVVVMDTADAPGTVDRLRLTASLELTAAAFHVSLHDLPSIVVFHLSKAAAAQLGRAVSSTAWSTGSTTYYEWWIIGEPSDLTYSYMAENTLEDHFKLKVEDSERGRILRTVLSRLDMTVDAKAFRKKGERIPPSSQRGQPANSSPSNRP